MERSFRAPWCGCLSLALLGALAGCASGPDRYNIKVSRSESLRASSTEVDLIGVNTSQLDRYMNYSVDKYWEPDDPMRKNAEKRVMTFSAGSYINYWWLPRADPVWQDWEAKGATDIVVITNVLGIGGDSKPDQDPRRLRVPLDRSRWTGWFVPQDIKLYVDGTGISLITAPKREEK